MTQYSIISNYPYGFTGNGSRCISSFGRKGNGTNDFLHPWYCDVNSSGDLVIADCDNHRIKYYQTKTFSPKLLAFGSDDTSSPAYLVFPKSVKFCPLPGADILLTDTGNRRIVFLKINHAQCHMEYVTSFGSEVFEQPTDVAVNRSNGNIVVVDTGLSRVSIHNQNGHLLALCQAPNFEMRSPSGVAISSQGDIYVSDTGNNCIRHFSGAGVYKSTLGSAGKLPGQFNNPKGLAFDAKGYLYVADEYNNRVLRYSPDLTHVTEAVGNVPLPKGVTVGSELYVTTSDDQSSVKVYYP